MDPRSGTCPARVLVVDDDAGTRLLFARWLENAGFEVAEASDGVTALKLLSHASFDILVLDSCMPGMNGRETLARLRADLRNGSLPVLIVTSDAEVSQRADGFADGADDVLLKPVDGNQLTGRIHALLRRSAGGENVQRLIETAHDAFLAWDSAGALLEWNPQAEAIFGWTKAETLTHDAATMVITPASRDAFHRAVHRSVAANDRPAIVERVDLVGILRDGSEIPIEMTVWAVSVGDTYTFSALVRSTAARRELECSLRTSERLQALMESTPDICSLTDIDGAILYASPSCRSLGYEPAAMVGRFGHEFIHPQDLLQHAEMQTAVLGHEGSTTRQLRVRAESGHYLWMDLTACAVRATSSGELTGIQTIARDATQRHATEATREQLVKELVAANRGLEEALAREHDMVREQCDLLKLKDEFVAMVSHELRTPLTSIVGYAEMLDDGELGELLDDQHRVLIVMDQNARRLVALVEDLLTIGRIEAGSFHGQREPLDVAPIIEAAGMTVLPSARSKNVVLDLDVDSDLGVVAADAAQLDRMLLNLLSNAVKFTPPGGRVELTARSSFDGVTIEVTDDGIGIPAAEQSLVFSRFFRARRSVEDEIPGTGLGLAIVKSIVEQHDGQISLVSEPGEGTKVSVMLPRALDHGRRPKPKSRIPDETRHNVGAPT